MVPVFVCVPVASGVINDVGFGIPTTPLRSEPIGYLDGFENVDLNDVDMVKRDLAHLGLPVRFFARFVRAEHGCGGALCALAVEVPTFESAKALPGFVALGDYSGSYPELPNKPDFNPIFTVPDHLIDGIPIKRCDVRDAYDDFVPPKYDGNGVFVMSSVPQGKIGRYVFLREDPMHIYVIPGGRGEEAKFIEAARTLAKLEPNERD